MRLRIIPPPAHPDTYPEPTGCPYPTCGSRHVRFRQAVLQPVRDLHIHAVIAHRDQCPRCGRTLRVYPIGISHDQTSARLKGIAVMLHVLGMRYGAVATALGCPLSKGAIYDAVQAAGAVVPRLRRDAVRRDGGIILAPGGGPDQRAVHRSMADGWGGRRCRQRSSTPTITNCLVDTGAVGWTT